MAPAALVTSAGVLILLYIRDSESVHLYPRPPQSAMRTTLFILLGAVLGVLATDKSIEVSFHPKDLPEKVASCQALNRVTSKQQGIDIRE